MKLNLVKEPVKRYDLICMNCVHSDMDSYEGYDNKTIIFYTCRKNPPVYSESKQRRIFPVVDEADWCSVGEWRSIVVTDRNITTYKIYNIFSQIDCEE